MSSRGTLRPTQRWVAGRLRRHPAGGLAAQVRPFDELRVANRLAGARGADDAVVDPQLDGGNAETPGGQLEEDLPHLDGGMTDRGTALFDRHAARRVALVGRLGRVGRHHADAVDGNVELVGGDLRQGGLDALAELHLAGEDGDGAVRPDADPAFELRGAAQAARQGLAPRRPPEPAEAEDQGAGAGEKGPARQAGAHRPDSLAARRIARRMRGCAPQRQRFRARARRICSSVGEGFRASNAAAPTIIPLVQ